MHTVTALLGNEEQQKRECERLSGVTCEYFVSNMKMSMVRGSLTIIA